MTFSFHIAELFKLAIEISENSGKLGKCKMVLSVQGNTILYYKIFQDTKGLIKTKTQIYKESS